MKFLAIFIGVVLICGVVSVAVLSLLDLIHKITKGDWGLTLLIYACFGALVVALVLQFFPAG